MSGIKSYLSVQEYKDMSNVEIDDHNIELALEMSAENLKNFAFYRKRNVYAKPGDRFRLDGPIADVNFDGVVDSTDINVIQYDRDDYVNPEIDLNQHVTSFNPKYSTIVLDADYPAVGKELVFEYSIARFENERMKPYLKRINMLLASHYMFTNLPIDKLQDGITTWTLNGVTVQFESSILEKAKTELKKESNYLLNQIKPLLYKKTRFGFDNDDKRRIGIKLDSPGGRRYYL